MEKKRIPPNSKIIWLVLAGIGVVISGLLWWNGRSATDAPSGHILYLGWEEGEFVNQLYAIDPEGGSPVRLTEMTDGITSFAVSPDGTQVAYTAANKDGAIDVWLMNTDGTHQKRIWSCEEALCTNPVWTVDGRRLIVERRLLSESGATAGLPRLWWLDTQTGETLSVFTDVNQTGLGAQVSPDGQWLSYLVPEAQEIRVTHLETGENLIIPTQTGDPAVWHPDSQFLITSDIWFQGELFSQHLFRADMASAELTNISGPEVESDDGQPQFSPDGEWLAFGRKKPRAPMGKQLWLMRPDGSEAVGLTRDADINYNNPAWSPGGTQIVVQGKSLAEPEAAPQLWLVDVASGELEEIVSPGIQPAWVP